MRGETWSWCLLNVTCSLDFKSQGLPFNIGFCIPDLLQVERGRMVERLRALMQIPFVLSHQVFLIIHHAPLVNSLAEVILNGDLSEMYAKPEQDVQRSCVSH